mgnify:CR=1 FL=1
MTQTEQFPAQCAAQESAAPDDEPQFDMQQVLQDNARLDQAILFATERHAGQLRKGTALPYILHPLETMQILSNMQADINLQIAGLLHDTIEDTDTTAAEIAALFGDDVAALVNHHSEDKSKSWLERKTQALTALQTADDRLKMLVLADKLSNLRSIARETTGRWALAAFQRAQRKAGLVLQWHCRYAGRAGSIRRNLRRLSGATQPLQRRFCHLQNQSNL